MSFGKMLQVLSSGYFMDRFSLLIVVKIRYTGLKRQIKRDREWPTFQNRYIVRRMKHKTEQAKGKGKIK